MRRSKSRIASITGRSAADPMTTQDFRISVSNLPTAAPMTRTVFEKHDVVPLVAEVFRELGYEGASMSAITERTKLSKGSLYHFFPGGKEEMAAEILAHVDAWFIGEVFGPLEHDEPRAALDRMWKSVDSYFRSGRRVCLVGAFALDET